MKATWVIIENYKKQLQSSRENCCVRFLKRDGKLYSFTEYNKWTSLFINLNALSRIVFMSKQVTYNQHPEQQARDIIDQKLEQAGWAVQSVKYF